MSDKCLFLHRNTTGILWVLLMFLIVGCAGIAPVVNRPIFLPDIVKEYRTVSVRAGQLGMVDSGIRLNEGEYLIMIANGKIDLSPKRPGRPGYYEVRPETHLLYRIGEGENDFAVRLGHAPSFPTRVSASGILYLGYFAGISATNAKGEAINQWSYTDDIGSFTVDVIILRSDDPLELADLFEKFSRSNPDNETLETYAAHLKRKKEILLAEMRVTSEVEEAKREIIALKEEEASQIEEANRKINALEEEEASHVELLPPKETVETKQPEENNREEIPLAEPRDPEKEKKYIELTERLQGALQALKDLEQTKKVARGRRRVKEKELLARLDQLEEEKTKRTKTPPLVVIASPQDGIRVDMDHITIIGSAEDEKGVAHMEILVNNQPVLQKGQSGLKIVAADSRRIDIAEQIRLREGRNQISIIVQNKEGIKGEKTILVHLDKKKGEVWAAVIGINNYKNLPSLKYSVNDAREFYRYLLEMNKIPKENIWLLLDEEATLDKIRSVLGTHLRRKAGKDDMVIIYLAGHGATERDSASLDGDGLEKYILPHNADPKDLYSSAIPMNEVARIFQRITADRLVFISDTCYSGASGGRTVAMVGARANLSGGFLDRLSHGKGRVILTASDANEVSIEKDELSHGVFTYYLLEALRGKGDLDGNGIITFDEVYRYVSLNVPQATGQEQHPVKKGEMKGEIILGVIR